jgi:hypothetical protein
MTLVSCERIRVDEIEAQRANRRLLEELRHRASLP